MNIYLEMLIDAYVENTVSTLDSNPQIVKSIVESYDKVDLAKQYAEDNLIVRSLKEHLELYDKAKQEYQVRLCLSLFSKLSDELNDYKIQVLKKMVEKFFVNKRWKNKKTFISFYYDNLPFFSDRKHFFFSYTNRNSEEVNLIFSKCLKNNKKYNIENKLAEHVVNMLLGRKLSGFWDYKDIKTGENIEISVKENCSKTFCFVQLLGQKSVKIPKKGSINWCFSEYEEFKKTGCTNSILNHNNMIFILQDGIIPKKNNATPYKDWINDINTYKHVKLTYDQDKNCNKIITDIDQIADRIEEIKKEALDKLLN